MKQYSYLALGDSYTIGEQVRIHESFPYQTVQLLRKYFSIPPAVENPGGGLEEVTVITAGGPDSRRQGLKGSMNFSAPEIVAVTGFTTDELDKLIDATTLLPPYDFVSLLIGVNNQYRGRTVDNFATELEALVQRAIQFAGNNAAHVIILSIPDWGVTPFAADSDKEKIAAEIDAFNSICQSTAIEYQCHYIDITTSQRKDGGKVDFLATDKLHPSGKEYAKWAAQLSDGIIKEASKLKGLTSPSPQGEGLG